MDAEVTAALVTGILGATGSIAVALYTIYKTNSNKRDLSQLEASLRKYERLEASRSDGYGVIWKLTGALNIFGTTTELNKEKLSNELKKWYFEHGMVLGKNSKDRYFLVQEILHFGMLHSATFERPDDKELFDSEEKQALDILRELRGKLPDFNNKIDELTNIQICVKAWKKQSKEKKVNVEENWVLLQYVLSKFRSGLIKDLGFDIKNDLGEE